MSQKVLVQAVSILELTEKEAEPLWSLLEEEKQKEIRAKKDPKDQLRSLLGYLLAAMASGSKLPVHFEKGEFGKPFIQGAPCFSISHSGSYVVCAISQQEVGVDIQRHTEIGYQSIAERFYQKDEIRLIRESQEPKKLFFDLWAKKESILKCAGVGLSRDFSKITALNEEVKKGRERYYTTLMPFIDGYSLAVCGKSPCEARFVWVGLGAFFELLKQGS